MTVEQLLARINERHGAGFRLRGRYALGENQGAYAVVDATGAPFVLKWDRRPERLPGLDRVRRITDRLRGLGAPVPAFVERSHTILQDLEAL